jgi:AhpD family alkylhydroperoxidase
MSGFVVHTTQTAPAPAGEKLAQIGKNWGFVPNLHGILAESPETLEGYEVLFGLVGKTTLTPVEQQVAFLAVNYENGCEYCMAGHTVLAGMAKVPEQAVGALRDGTAIDETRLETLRAFVAQVVRDRGDVGDAAVAKFLAAGFTKRNVLEIVLIVATKTISNYANHIAHTPNDAFMANTAWTAPARRARAA